MRALLVFPSASLTFMRGSIGELTALMRATKSSQGDTFQWRYLELVSGPGVLPRSKRMMASVGCETLLTARDSDDLNNTPLSTVRKRLEQVLRFRPDVVVLSSFRAFVQYPRFPDLIAFFLLALNRKQIPVLILDPCGDSFLWSGETNCDVLIPAPFTYRYARLPHQRIFSALTPRRGAPPACDGQWLWLAAPWMSAFLRFRIAERVGLRLLADLQVPVSSLGALEDPGVWCPGSTTVEDTVSFQRLESIIARKIAIVTANARSVLAARAASWGVPVVVVDPTRLPSKGVAKAHGVTSADLARASLERIPEFPVPAEVITLEPDRRAALDLLRQVRQNEEGNFSMRRERREAYRGYPDFAQVIAQYV